MEKECSKTSATTSNQLAQFIKMEGGGEQKTIKIKKQV